MIKEEPLDYEDIDIKEEQIEMELLEFNPEPRAFGKNLAHRKPKFVYGKRINRTKSAPNMNQDFEFDHAAQLSTPFSPPKSSWPVSKGQDEVQSEEDEPEEEREMRQKVDQLMSEGTIDDADELYQLFTKTIKQCTDPTENVFNTVLTLFKERKERGETCPATPEKRPVEEKVVEEEDDQAKSCLFPMSDHEIYNQDVSVNADVSTPAEDFVPTIIKTEQVEEPGIELTAPANGGFSTQYTARDAYTELVPAMAECNQTEPSSSGAPRGKDWKKVDGVDLYYDTANDKMFQPLGKGIKIEPGYQPMIFPPKKYTYPQPPRQHTYPQPPKDRTYPQPPRQHTYPQGPKQHTYPQGPKEHTYPQSKERRPSAHSLYSKTTGEVTEAERLFDELIEEEQVPFVPQDPNQTSFIEPFRPDGVFSNQSLDDLIKAPLVPNEHCIKPKPSYAPMTFDNSENKPPVVLFSSKPDEGGQKQDPGWGSWKRPSNETTFDHFQTSSEWGDNPSSWSPGHSDWEEPYFGNPSTAQQSGFDDPNKDPLDKSCGSDDDMAVRHPVTQRHVQTQFPYDNIYSEIEYSWPQTTYIKERQICINHSFTQTPGPPLFPLSLAPGRFRRRRPVLVEPLPTIEPIGDTVTQLRTMRTSDSYSLLMERLRTCTDPSFDRFMNSQRQPTGLVSTFNQFACYSPQANIPELPLTVNKSYSDKSNSVGKRPGIVYKEVTPKPYSSHHSTTGLTPYQISVKIRKMGQVENIIGRLQRKKRNSANCKPKVKPR